MLAENISEKQKVFDVQSFKQSFIYIIHYIYTYFVLRHFILTVPNCTHSKLKKITQYLLFTFIKLRFYLSWLIITAYDHDLLIMIFFKTTSSYRITKSD